MFWYLPDHRFGGVVIVRFGGEYHLFTTKQRRETTPSSRAICHHVSRDLINWQELPDAITGGEPGAFDAFALYDLHVTSQAGRYYLFYTGLDRPHGRSQIQATGIALSDDLIHWQRYEGDPVITADPRWYEQQVPDEATYQEKDRGRMWFRDPWVMQDPVSGQWTMAVGARTAGGNPDLRGCIAWATSPDLLHWTPQPPLYAPERFHTLECPVLLSHGKRWYLITLTHHGWGTPFITTDPDNFSGGFYAVSESGIGGPYRQPHDEVLVGGSYLRASGERGPRAMVIRTFDDPSGNVFASYHLRTEVAPEDEVTHANDRVLRDQGVVMPLVKPVRFGDDPEMYLTCNPVVDTLSRSLPLPVPQPATRDWQYANAEWRGKDFREPSVHVLGDAPRDIVCSANVEFIAGLRAGLAVRCGEAVDRGWTIFLDRNRGCVEFGLLGGQCLDRRKWSPANRAELKVVLDGPSIEIYCDDRLMLHQVRYREAEGKVGLIVDQAEARFQALTLREFVQASV